MTRICWWLAGILSGLLEPDEREAVRGDLAESGQTGGRALVDVLGLVVRRQAALWKSWRPWLALVGLVVPLGMLLCLISRLTAGLSAVYIWMYANNGDWTFLGNAGFRRDFADNVALILIEYLTLACWSWTGGFVLGLLSRRTIRVNGALFCLVLLFGELWGTRDFDPNDPLLALTFYRVVFPLIVQAVLVLIPSLWGMRQGLRVARLRPPLRAILWTAAIATLAAFAIRSYGLAGFHMALPRFGRLLQLVVYWPVVYFIASVLVRRATHERQVRSN